MHMHNLNWLAILVAAISTMVGGIPVVLALLFANAWVREMGYDPNARHKARMNEIEKERRPGLCRFALASIVSAFTLALILHGLRAKAYTSAWMVSSPCNGSDIVATVQLTGALFAGSRA